jgi:uncharacterized protein YyaL (SSP411 family)
VTTRKGAPNLRFRFSPRPNRAHEIHWHEWGPQAFEEAARQDKPMLLSLSAVWCHWCHVMDETTYSDEAVIQHINDQFVPVRVDNDQRPDINLRYNMGGWPTTAFLTPEGDILTGATYLPPERMRELLPQLAAHYRGNREQIQERIQEMLQQRQAGGRIQPASLDERIFFEVLRTVSDAYDPVYGGFDDAPKFPHSDAIDLLVYAYQLGRDPDILHMARKTLEYMARGGVFDQEWGGFFRYATNRDWSVPHFEKMLEDNARLLSSYLHLYRATGEQFAAQVASRIIAYLDGHLWNEEQGYFGGSQDADEHFYTLSTAERELLPVRSADSASTDGGEPYIDPTCYTSWNALAASAYLEASWVLEQPELAERALRVLEFLWGRCRKPASGMYRFYDGRPHLPGLLGDQAQTAIALLNAYEVTGDALHLKRARQLATFIRERFADPEGGFFDTWDENEGLGRLRERQKSVAENAAAAVLFTRLHRLTGDETAPQAAKGTLEAFAGVYGHLGYFAAAYAQAVHLFLSPYAQVEIVGDVAEHGTRALLQTALRLDLPARSVRVLHPQRDVARLKASLLPAEPWPAAYVCYNTTCSPPVTEPHALAEAAESMRRLATSG